MSFQGACLNACKVTLVALVCFFPTVCFQMHPQMVRIRWCIVTLIAFVWLCLSYEDMIGCAFTRISFFKILIHFQHVRSVLSLAISLSNWLKKVKMTYCIDFRFEGKKMKVKSINIFLVGKGAKKKQVWSFAKTPSQFSITFKVCQLISIFYIEQ